MDELRAYQILGLEPGCSMEELRAAYANQSKKYHPEESPEEFQQIHEAYALLKGRVRRGGRRQEASYPRQESEHFRQDSHPGQKPGHSGGESERKFENERGETAYHFDEILQNSQEQPKERIEETESVIRFKDNREPFGEGDSAKKPESAEDSGTAGAFESRYDFEDALRQGEKKESQRIHENVLKALAEIQILFSPQYCNKVKLWKNFFAKPEYQEAIHTAEFIVGFADLLADRKLKKVLYSYFVSVYRLRGAEIEELTPEMRRLYAVLDQKMGGIRMGTNRKVFYGGIPAAVLVGLRSARVSLDDTQVLGALLYVVVTIFVCYLIFKKIYENHSSIFAQTIVALLVFVMQIVAILTPLNSKIFRSVETGDVFAVLVMMLALLWLGILGIAAIIRAMQRRGGRK